VGSPPTPPVTAISLGRAQRKAFLAMLADYEARDPENGGFYAPGRIDFDAYVERLRRDELGLDLPPGYVPCSHRWLVDAAGTMVGVVRVRHRIDTPFLAEDGGHIGYDVPPSLRGRGYGTACLVAGLGEAQALGLARVLLCVDAHNVPSWRTVERCGGALEVERWSDAYQCLVRRYWISVAPMNAPSDA
jgi:predicted acetyltransferase